MSEYALVTMPWVTRHLAQKPATHLSSSEVNCEFLLTKELLDQC